MIETQGSQLEANKNYAILEKNIKNCVEKSKEVRTKILNKPKENWINKSVIDNINIRNSIWAELCKNPHDNNIKEKFSTKKNEVAKHIRITKDSYYSKEFTKFTKEPKRMWNLVNTLAKNKINKSCDPPKLIVNGNDITDPNQVCNVFNSYFATIGQLLAAEIPKRFHDRTMQALPTPLFTDNSQLTLLEPCTEEEILKIINQLDSNSSSGLDGINTKAIKCIKNFISKCLAASFNKLFLDGTFPGTLKIAKVTPIYKSGPKTDPGNYRPISVLPIFSKILEKLLYTRLQNYLSSINFISSRQYGFRSKSNTLTATIDLVTKIKQNIDEKNIVLGVFIDLKKAFDTVSHVLLLEKLKIIGVSGSALEMFKSYLSQRYQIVKIGSNQSTALPITCGVPQGSVLGSLLFLIYVNNIQELGLNGHITLYADDTCLFYFGSSIHNLISQAQEDLNVLFNWFQYNLLTINISKTCFTIFNAKNKQIPLHAPLTINNITLQQKTHEKYLGLYIDTKLTWQVHINEIKKKLLSICGSLRNLVRCIPHKLRYTLYNALVKPHLTYLIEIWGNASNTKISEIQILQNKIIKLLFNYHYLTSTKKIYNETNIMNIKSLYRYNTCILIRKIINKNIHTNITLTKQKSVTARSTRRASFLVLPKPRTNYGKTMITFEGAQLYNRLPAHVKNENSFNIFKKKLAEYIVANQ